MNEPALLPARIRDLARASRIIPNITSAGSYDFLSQTIEISRVTAPFIHAWSDSPHYLSLAADYLTTSLHELTHWLDHTTTLWGQREIVAIHEAYWAHGTNDARQFWRVMRLENSMSRGPAAATRYFLTVDQPDAMGSATTWQWNISVGLEFDAAGRLNRHRPIAFVNFHDRDDKRIVRMPMTTMALLEVNAMWAEYDARMAILSSADAVTRAIDERAYRERALHELYHPELAVYSVAAHVVATSQSLPNAYVAYRAASALSLLALNLPGFMIRKLPVPAGYSGEARARVKTLLANGDRGYVFLRLVQASPPLGTAQDLGPWLEDTLAAAKLPSLDRIRAAAEAEMAAFANALPPNGWPRDRAAVLLRLGRENFVHRGLAPERPLTLAVRDGATPYQLPPVVLEDGAVHEFAARTVSDAILEPYASVSRAWDYRTWASSFVDACRA